MKTPRFSRDAAAFTLIELLTVIAIIGILAALVLGSIGMVRKKAQQTRCVANLRQVGVAILLYVDDHKGRLPGPSNVRIDTYYKKDASSIQALIAPYMTYPDSSSVEDGVTINISQLRCPARPFTKASDEATFITQCNMRRIASNQTDPGRPFGKKDGTPEVQETPILFAELENYGGPSRIWALMEADQEVPWGTISSVWKDKLPLTPAHGGSRTTLYFDGRVALLSQLPAKI